MKLELRARGVRLSEKLKIHIESQVRSAMGRFGDRVLRVRVSLKDLNGPKGGEDIRCEIQADLAHRGAIMIKETSINPFLAVALASNRASHALSRQVGRLKQRRRGR
jgi:putative sigma-54 modulation protein